MVKRTTKIENNLGGNTIPNSATPKKRAVINLNDIIEESNSNKALLEGFSDAMESGSSIAIDISGKETLFYLQTIPYEEILERTFVSSQNGRRQKWLNVHTLSTLIDTIRSRGQMYPALGILTEDGRIDITDGSRRRMSCHFAQREFKVFVTDSVIPSEVLEMLSNEANEHLQLSLIELSYQWAEEYERGGYNSYRAFSRDFNLNLSLVSTAMKARNIPESLQDLFPYPPMIGRSIINNLDLLCRSSLRTFTPDELAKLNDTKEGLLHLSPAEANKQFLAQLKEQLVGKVSKTRAKKIK
ncbi:hypothetical protein ERJ77_27985, partial [Vibrio anguillarum]|nr:hypothetical protein [Vibrio anguillarum]